jgi:hypothetical protein
LSSSSSSFSVEESDETPPPRKKGNHNAAEYRPVPKHRGKFGTRVLSSDDERTASILHHVSSDELVTTRTRQKDDEQKLKPKPKSKKKRQPVKEETPQRVELELIEEEEQELPVVPVRFEIEEQKFTPKSWSPLRPIQREMSKPF